jgi:hypothetical protein
MPAEATVAVFLELDAPFLSPMVTRALVAFAAWQVAVLFLLIVHSVME